MPPSVLDDHWLYQCDDIAVDPCAHRLVRAGQVRPVEPKAYTVLVRLLEQAGDVVDKETLLDAAWGHRHVTPGVLSHAISQLRHALGDSALHPRYIATVHTIGYRFMGEVHRRPRPAPVLTDPAPDGEFTGRSRTAMAKASKTA
jgi:DNA-binding winged helix-turn-helix (wHTH) protein